MKIMLRQSDKRWEAFRTEHLGSGFYLESNRRLDENTQPSQFWVMLILLEQQ